MISNFFQFIKKNTNKFWLHSFIFIVLSILMLFNAIPTILLIPEKSNRPETLTAYGVLFNELYERSPSLYESNYTKAEISKYIKYLYPVFGDHHMMLNVYRAVKTGKHLSNMGYNESAPWEVSVDEKDPNYKSVYLSTFNNFAEISYYFMPEKKMDTKEKELINAAYMSTVRYILGAIHILGFICIFMLTLKYLGVITAWCVGTALLLYPITLVGGIFSSGFVCSLLIYIAFIIYVYPKVLTNWSFKKYLYFVIIFTIGNGFLIWLDGIVRPILYTWAPSIVCAFLIELYNIYDKPKNIKTQIRNSILRVLGLVIVSLLIIIPIAYLELQQMKLWLPNDDTLSIMSNRASSTLMKDSSLQTTLDWIKHIYNAYYQHLLLPMTAPHIWVYRWSTWVLNVIPRFLYNMPFIIGAIIVGLLTVKIGKVMKYPKEFKDLVYKLVIAIICYNILFLSIAILFPRMMYHYHMFSPNLIIYQILILAVFLGQILTLFFSKYNIEWTFLKSIKKEQKELIWHG